MPTARHAILIDAPREEVWRVLADPARAPDWVYGVRRVEFVTDARTGVGAAWRQVNVHGPAVVVHLNEVTVARAPERYVVESGSKPHVEVAHTLDDERGRTRLTIEMDYDLPYGPLGGGVAAVVGDEIGRVAVRRSAENLKRLVEARRRRREAAGAQTPEPDAAEAADDEDAEPLRDPAGGAA